MGYRFATNKSVFRNSAMFVETETDGEMDFQNVGFPVKSHDICVPDNDDDDDNDYDDDDDYNDDGIYNALYTYILIVV